MLINQKSKIFVDQNSYNTPELLQKVIVFWGRFLYFQIEMVQYFQFGEIDGKSLGISWLLLDVR